MQRDQTIRPKKTRKVDESFNTDFMDEAGRLRSISSRTQTKILAALNEKSMSNLFDDGDQDKIGDLIVKIKEDLSVLPEKINFVI